ncbi:hypothetical protein SAMN05421548_101439 [Paraburkholderia lycopersici]|uniref:Uncharacterized protein n=1 Tax=Paraburkholderia lycopersici TaxID=416944 RepID=A0A1G6GZL6_9BURK|nr:hypothetical protein SAMN05421548_101439 [Paraburkholderia lycopersici]
MSQATSIRQPLLQPFHFVPVTGPDSTRAFGASARFEGQVGES